MIESSTAIFTSHVLPDGLQPIGDLNGANGRGGLVSRLDVLGLRHRVGHYPGAGLDARAPGVNDRRANGDRQVGVSREVKISHDAPVQAPASGLELVDELDGARLWRARKRSGGKDCRQAVDGRLRLVDAAGDGR